MTFYNILWITIFSLGGISLGLLGLLDLNYFSVLMINSSMFNNLILKTEELYVGNSIPASTDTGIGIRYQTQKI
jgi:hypothetical protein